MQENIYDTIIIGGGISGLNTAYELAKSTRVLLLDERNYLGGRIQTYFFDENNHVECGAGRLNNNHRLLLNLIKKLNLNLIKLNGRIDFKSKKHFIKYINKKYIKIIKIIVDNYHKFFTNKQLKKMTFMQLCIFFYRSNAYHLRTIFGYRSEFDYLNAYDALRTIKKDFLQTKFYVIKEGFNQLCLRLKEICYATIILNSFVKDVFRECDKFSVTTDKGIIYCARNVVFAVKAHQLFAFDILWPINYLLEAVVARPLLRIYAQYPLVDNKVWFDNFYTTITDSRLKYLIPMDKKTGIIMISYTDSDDVLSFLDENNKLKSEEEIIIIIEEEEIRKLYSLEIPKPLKLKTCYWSEGCHYWRKNYDSDKISREIINPQKNLYICGEAFSQNQCWIEGALETSYKVVRKILKN